MNDQVNQVSQQDPVLRNKGCQALGTAIALILASFATPPAVAQDNSSTDDVLDEVLVTARFREEKLQDIGAAVTAFDGSQLEKYAITDLSSIVDRTPGVDMYNRGPNKSDISIRGMANLLSQTDFQRVSNLTGMFFDGVSAAMPFNSQRLWNMYDLERVEILRGPQGTLYGEGAMGGALRYVSRSPVFNEFEARLNGTFNQVDGGDDIGYHINGTVNIPLIDDRFALRVTAFKREDPGFIDYNVAGVEDANSFESSGARAVAVAQISDALTIKAMVMYEDSTSDTEWTATEPVDDLDNNFHEILQPQFDRGVFGSLQVDYRTAGGTFSAISGYYRRDMDDLGLDPTVTGALGGLLTEKDFRVDHEAFSQELRFVSDKKGRVGYLAGLYYKNSEQHVREGELIYLAPGVPSVILDEDEYYDGEQVSAFGEVSFDITPRLTGTLGLRYFKEEVDSTQIWRSPEVIFSFAPDSTFNTPIEIEEFLPKALLEFKPMDGVLLYTGATRGARNGGLNVTSTITLIAATGTDNTPFRTYDQDSAWSYEIGAKTTWLGGRLTANVAAYRVDWKDIQLTVSSPPLPFFDSGLGFVGNSEAARSVGGELELDYRPSANWRVYLGANVANAEITQDTVVNQTLNLIVPEGSPIPGVPDWTFNVGGEWSQPIAQTMSFTARANYQRRAGSNSFIVAGEPNEAAPDNTTPEYGTLNLGVGLEGDTWRVDLFANNITNEVVALYEGYSNSGFYINKPRTIGLILEKSF